MTAPDNRSLWALSRWEITPDQQKQQNPVQNRFYMLMWLLPEVCYISLPGKVCDSFIGSTGTGSRKENVLFTERCSLKSVCVCSGAGERSRSPGSRSKETDTGERVGQIPGGTSNLEGACYFWYLLYVVYFYTHWKNKVRWDLTQTMFVPMKRFGIFVRT